MTAQLHNMSVPPTSVVAVRRTSVPGRRFRVDFESVPAGRSVAGVERDLAREGWRAAWRLLAANGDAPPAPAAGRGRARRSREALDAHLETALAAAGVPAAVGVFLEEPAEADVPRLGAAAALAVASRRSGPVYLPRRRFEPSLARLSSAVLFFPSAGDPAAGPSEEVTS